MSNEVEPTQIKLMYTDSLKDAVKALESAAELGLGIEINSEYHPTPGDRDSQSLWWKIALFDEVPETDPDAEDGSV
ncbi:hypothetical protein ACFW5I_19965 [Streptomyces sp. NPDC058818]|uniref:hypothetical protein n=1 Tax=Streptomyces sp. NPDC058818 TaxID=3346640 RepID=UPI0036B2A701